MNAGAQPVDSNAGAIREFRVNVPEADLADLREAHRGDPVARAGAGSWTQAADPRLVHYNRLAKGGHFAPWEPSQVFCEELRAGFRPLRQ